MCDPGPNPEQTTERREARKLLDEILDEMDDDPREVFVLFELEATPRAEIAALLDVPEGTCASRLRRAREQFEASAKRMRARETFSRRQP